MFVAARVGASGACWLCDKRPSCVPRVFPPNMLAARTHWLGMCCTALCGSSVCTLVWAGSVTILCPKAVLVLPGGGGSAGLCCRAGAVWCIVKHLIPLIIASVEQQPRLLLFQGHWHSSRVQCVFFTSASISLRLRLCLVFCSKDVLHLCTWLFGTGPASSSSSSRHAHDPRSFQRQ